MRDPNRIPHILGELEKIWKELPDLRLGQLILNVVGDPTLYYLEDEDLIKVLRHGYKFDKENTGNDKNG